LNIPNTVIKIGRTFSHKNSKDLAYMTAQGIRTTVFLKGCNLMCPWCRNPENIKMQRKIYFKKKGLYRMFWMREKVRIPWKTRRHIPQKFWMRRIMSYRRPRRLMAKK